MTTPTAFPAGDLGGGTLFQRASALMRCSSFSDRLEILLRKVQIGTLQALESSSCSKLGYWQ